MFIELAWWDLNENDPDVDFLAASLNSQVLRQWEGVHNMTAKLWLVSRNTPRWGALMIWHGAKPDISTMPPNMSAQIIGRPPDHRTAFDVLNEACLDGWSLAPLREKAIDN